VLDRIPFYGFLEHGRPFATSRAPGPATWGVDATLTPDLVASRGYVEKHVNGPFPQQGTWARM
jgi:hypothetical protein